MGTDDRLPDLLRRGARASSDKPEFCYESKYSNGIILSIADSTHSPQMRLVPRDLLDSR